MLRAVCPCEKLAAFVTATLSPILRNRKVRREGKPSVKSEFDKSLSMLELYSTAPDVWLPD